MAQKELKLSPRLACIASLVPRGASLADVGTDHGYLPAYLLQSGRIRHAIASDIAAEPLARARQTAEELCCSEMEFRLCAGLTAILPGECDTIAVAGMGGETIIEILSAAPWTRDGMHVAILQPQTKIELLRRWLAESGYRCMQERLVRDREKLYVVLAVAAGTRYVLSEEQAYGGFALERDELYGEYLAVQTARLRRRAEGLERSGSAAEAERFFALARAMDARKGEWENGKGT